MSTAKSHTVHVVAAKLGFVNSVNRSEKIPKINTVRMSRKIYGLLRVGLAGLTLRGRSDSKFLAASGARPALMIALLLFLLFLLLFLLAFSSFSHLSLFVPCYGTFCAFPWHISLKSLFVPCYGTFCAFPWHISLKSLFVPCYGTFCAFP
jgi:hypothetical protein